MSEKQYLLTINSNDDYPEVVSPVVDRFSSTGTPVALEEESKGGGHSPKPGTSSFLACAFLLWTDICGIGPLATGFYMATGGVAFTIISVLFVAFIADYTLRGMYTLAEKYKKADYVEMNEFALKKPGRLLACFFMFVYNFGGFCANLLVIGAAVPPLLTYVAGGHFYWIFGRTYVLLVLIALAVPVCFLKNIGNYAWLCYVTISCFTLGVIMLIGLGIHEDVLTDGFKSNGWTWMNGGSALGILGGLCYVFVCHDMSFSVALSLKRPSARRWAGIVRLCIGTNVFLAILLGLFSYSVFGAKTDTFLPNNYVGVLDGLLPNLVRFFISMMIITSIPYSCFLPRMALENLFYTIFPREKFSPKKQKIIYVIQTLSIPLGALLIAEFVTDLGIVIEFLGGFSAAGLGFILPPAMFIKLEPSWKKKWPYVLVFIFGVFCVVLAIVNTAVAVVHKNTG